MSRLCSRYTELGESVSERGLILRFLANENFPAAAVASLAAAGHDVVWVRIVAPGMPDPDVLAWAAREHRILLTFDKDFGELARGSALPRTCGVSPYPADALAAERQAAIDRMIAAMNEPVTLRGGFRTFTRDEMHEC